MTKTVLLTGAASGIGLESALFLAREGWRLVMLDRNAEALEEVRRRVEAISALGHLALPIDLCDPHEIAALWVNIPFELNAIVNNAGLSDSLGTPLTERDFTSLEAVFSLNLQAPQLLLKALRACFAPSVRVVNVASGAGLRAIPWRGAYSASKAGLIAFGKSWAKANPAHQAITLCPGFIRTALVEQLIAQGRLSPAQSVAKIPLCRMGTPSEVAACLSFLLSDAAAALNGQTVSFDGGSSIFGGSKAYELQQERPVSDMQVVDLTGFQGFSLIEKLQQAAQSPFDALTLLLAPAEGEAEHAAALMLMQSLACEIGPLGRRVNAIICHQRPSPDFLDAVSGPKLSYLTGQVLQYGMEL